MLEVLVPEPLDNQPSTKKGILSHLASINDPLGIISPTTVKGKQIYRDTCQTYQLSRFDRETHGLGY